MRFRPEVDLEYAIDAAHNFVGNTAYHLNRANGLLERLELAIKADAVIEPESLSAINLANDIKELRSLASKLELARLRLLPPQDVEIDDRVPF